MYRSLRCGSAASRFSPGLQSPCPKSPGPGHPPGRRKVSRRFPTPQGCPSRAGICRGPAGTGKTRLISEILGTFHKLVYKYAVPPEHDGEDVKFEIKGRKPPRPGVGLVICDEASMLKSEDVDALEASYRVVYLGDPAQLPPVISEPGPATARRRLPTSCGTPMRN